MQCIIGMLENEMAVEWAEAGTGEYWWSRKKTFLIKMDPLVNPGLKKISFYPWFNARSSATGMIVRDSLMMLWSVASWTKVVY